MIFFYWISPVFGKAFYFAYISQHLRDVGDYIQTSSLFLSESLVVGVWMGEQYGSHCSSGHYNNGWRYGGGESWYVIVLFSLLI